MQKWNWRRLLCVLTYHSWVPILADAKVLCECEFCGARKWREWPLR